jgi:alpha-amylase/alpha-mannosidase (GH57 family)
MGAREMNRPLRLALIWHFHQPDYTDPATGAPSMPWTRLHAIKDYADMAAHLERHPGVRATFNVVPTLLDQLRVLASGSAKPDRFLELAAKAPEDLTFDERRFLIGQFFSLNRATMGAGLRRLHELAALRGDLPAAEIGRAVVDRFDAQSLRDLQVLFHLAWSGPLLAEEPLWKRLRDKGRGFDEDDKHALLARQGLFVAEVLPRWKRLADSGQVELSVSPYYHPILPLLCDLGAAQEALPGLALPRADFRHPEDADLQLSLGMDAFSAEFGRRALGGWPSEGAISESALHRMGLAGYRWAASDEDVLFASLGEILPADGEAMERRRAELLYRPWRFGTGPVLLFRDHDLSDRIGFRYAARDPREAAGDFVDRLLAVRSRLPDDGTPYVASVILDGENAWEHFPDNGAPFFDALYGALEREPSIETVTAATAADAADAHDLRRVVAGSWIYRNLATWIGHPEKNRAWELLAAARDAVAAARGSLDAHDPAWRMILAAEGSDWFWWFGDDHQTAHAAEFDAAFRDKLRAAYEAAGLPVPDPVREPIRRGAARGYVSPSGRVRATLDGRITDFFEWQAAGHVEAVYGAMQSGARLVRQLVFGTDGTDLYLRVDPFEPGCLEGARLTLRVAEAPDRTFSARAGAAEGGLRTVLDRVLEAAVPLASLVAAGETLRFAIEIVRPDGAHQRVPADGFVSLPSPETDPARFDWSV